MSIKLNQTNLIPFYYQCSLTLDNVSNTEEVIQKVLLFISGFDYTTHFYEPSCFILFDTDIIVSTSTEIENLIVDHLTGINFCSKTSISIRDIIAKNKEDEIICLYLVIRPILINDSSLGCKFI